MSKRKSLLEKSNTKMCKMIKLDKDSEELNFTIGDMQAVLFELSLVGRVKSIGNCRSIQNRYSEGSGGDAEQECLLTFELQDKNTSCIRVTCFNDEARKIKNILKDGNLYKLSHFYVRPCFRTKTNSDCMFEIEMRGDSVIEKVEDLEDFAAIVPEKYTALKNIKSVEDGQRISVKGQVTEAGERTHETSKRGTEYNKQQISLEDSSKEIELGLWRPCIENKGVIVGQKIVIRNLEVRSFKGKKQASIQYDSTIQICQSDSDDDATL